MDNIHQLLNVSSTDPDDRRRARLLNIFVLGMGALAVIAFMVLLALRVFNAALWQNFSMVFWNALIFLVLLVFVYLLNRRGKVLFASILFVIDLILIFMFTNVEAMGSGGTSFYFVIPVLLSSVLIRPYASFITSGFISLLLIGAVIGLQLSSEVYLGIFGFFAIAFVSWISARNLDNALKDLRTINEELDQRVVERTRELAEANSQLERQARDLASANFRLARQAEELSDANIRLQSLDKLKSKFVSDVTHELRTPISNLTIYLEMLEESDPERRERYQAVLREETKRLSNLISDVLDLSRMEMGMVAPKYAWLDFDDVVEQIVSANWLGAEAKELNFNYSIVRNLPLIFGDREQLVMALSNLVSNAINYTQNGEVNVEARLDTDQQTVIFQVQDTGMGIESDDLPHLFDRFYRGRQASQSSIPGTGLGLAIAKEIIEAHRGSIEVESEFGVGSTFTVHLPLRDPESEKTNPTV